MINQCIYSGDPDETTRLLKMPPAKLDNIHNTETYMYLEMLVFKKKQKVEETGDSHAKLCFDEIQSVIDKANETAKKGINMSVGVAAINEAIKADSAEALMAAIKLPDVDITGVMPDCGHNYLTKLQQIKEEKQSTGSCGSGWMLNPLEDGFTLFFNVMSMVYTWTHIIYIIIDRSLLTKQEIQSAIKEMTDAHNSALQFKIQDHISQEDVLTLQGQNWLNDKDIPKQTNQWDCGGFICQFAEYITREAPLSFTQSSMPALRRKMVLEINMNELCWR